ncbi:MAG: hypothetical protein IPI85_14045 [Dehalococcoidia bacterium]|nr:hypothetical protein [Dehalococcoidia bacterium]
MRQADSPSVHLDANVRESWVSRTVSSDDTAPVNVRIVRGLFTLAEIPGQSTVTISRRAASNQISAISLPAFSVGYAGSAPVGDR